MLPTHTELVLRDITSRLQILMGQVSEGELVDTNLLEKLNEVSELIFLKHQSGQEITTDELALMTDLLCLLEMRTTLIYGNYPEN